MAGETETKPAELKAIVEYLPADFEGREIVAQYKTPLEFAKAHVNLRRDFDKKLHIPSSTEERKAFFTSLGVPEKPDAYESSPDVPDDLKDVATSLRAPLHAANLTKEQFKHVTKAMAQALGEHRERTIAANSLRLRAELGGKADEEIATAERILTSFFDAPTQKRLRESAIANSLEFVQTINKLKASVGLPTQPGTSAQPTSAPTAQSIATRMKEIYNNPGYKDYKHAQNTDLVAEFQKLANQLTELNITGVLAVPAPTAVRS